MKPIKVSQELKQSLLEKFAKYLDENRMSNNKVDFTTTLYSFDAKNVIKPIIYFTPEAYLKTLQLVRATSTEIGWHGIVKKEDNRYIIEDIIVYPQTVTGATVTTDEKEYGEWLMTQPDETFFNIRFQGHSHVNFGVSPSATDMQFYDSILQTLREGDYYIFMIMNKKHDINIMLYDFSQNVIFEKEDIDLKVVLNDFSDLDIWCEDNQKKYVKTFQAPTKLSNPTVRYLSDEDEHWSKKGYSGSIDRNMLDDDGYSFAQRLDRDYERVFGVTPKNGRTKKGPDYLYDRNGKKVKI